MAIYHETQMGKPVENHFTVLHNQSTNKRKKNQNSFANIKRKKKLVKQLECDMKKYSRFLL